MKLIVQVTLLPLRLRMSSMARQRLTSLTRSEVRTSIPMFQIGQLL